MFEFIKVLKTAKQVGVLSGAGLSAESGIPTFRGKDGLWNRFNPAELATFEAFLEDPKLVWKWYIWRMHLIANSQPNSAHYAIADMEKIFRRFLHITQNVDGLHREAGGKKFVELHGYIFDGKCRFCGKHYPAEVFSKLYLFASKSFLRSISKEELKKEVFRRVDEGELPVCRNCGETVGPGVVWFGENLPEEAVEEAFNFAEECDVFIVVGTSGLVQPAASLPLIAKGHGATLIEINPQETPLSPYCDFVLRDSASSVLPRFPEALKS